MNQRCQSCGSFVKNDTEPTVTLLTIGRMWQRQSHLLCPACSWGMRHQARRWVQPD